MIIRLYKHDSNISDAFTSIDTPKGWAEACAKNVVHIETTNELSTTIQRGSITLSTTDKYTGYSYRYATFIEVKQQHMQKGGALQYTKDYQHAFTKDMTSMCADAGYLMTINSIVPNEHGNISIVGGHAVGVTHVNNGMELGVLKQYGDTDSRRRVLLEACACLWIVYHKFNELLYRCIKTQYADGLVGLLNNYYAACLRWNYYMYSKLHRTDVINSDSVLTISWGHTCAQCTEPGRVVRVVFETDLKFEQVPADLIVAPDSAAKLLSMSGEYVPYVSPVSSNVGTLTTTVDIDKYIADEGVVKSTGYGDDRVFEKPAGMKINKAYNNWTKIEVKISVPELRQGDRVAHLIQLVRGGRSMSGRVLSSEYDELGMQTFDVKVTVYDPYIVPGNDNHISKNSTETLVGYVTVTENKTTEESGA